MPVIAIVGYTNAGKSTLLNHLTDADVLEEDKLFATLDPTTRILEDVYKRQVEELGGEVVKALFLIELAGLNGREALKGYDVESVVKYDGK